MKKLKEVDQTTPLYHNTTLLLKKYREVAWNLELDVQHVKHGFKLEYGKSIEEFLDSIYLAGADIGGSKLEHYAQNIERNYKMLSLVRSALELIREKHMNGEEYYWILYYTYIIPQHPKNTEEIIENLRPHIQSISYRTYYRKRPEAIDVLSNVLWGYTAADSIKLLEKLIL